jgi:hypothetical protein
MADWGEEDRGLHPVRYRTGQRPQGREPAPWAAMNRGDSREVQKRLAWLLLAAEIGMAVVAACVLPLVFIELPRQQEGVIGAIVTKVGEWLGLSSQVACLVVALPIPILLVTLGANWWWFRRIRRRAKQTDDQESI